MKPISHVGLDQSLRISLDMQIFQNIKNPKSETCTITPSEKFIADQHYTVVNISMSAKKVCFKSFFLL